MKMATCHPDRKHHGRGLCQQCYMHTYFKAHPEKWDVNRAMRAKYYRSHKEEYFIRNNPECGHELDRIRADIASGLDWEGNPLTEGMEYDKEHNHETGEYYGHVPKWLNAVFTKTAIANWGTVLRYANRRGIVPIAGGIK